MQVVALGGVLVGGVDDGCRERRGSLLAGGGANVLSILRLANGVADQLRDGGRESARLSDTGLSQAG